MLSKCLSNNVWKDFRLPMSALVMAARKCFKGKFKMIFQSGILSYPADTDIGSPKFLIALFNKHLEHMLVKFDQNRMVRTITSFELFENKNSSPFLTKH